MIMLVREAHERGFVAPAEDYIEYKAQKFTRGLAGDVPVYERPPSLEVDKAWEELYMCECLHSADAG